MVAETSRATEEETGANPHAPEEEEEEGEEEEWLIRASINGSHEKWVCVSESFSGTAKRQKNQKKNIFMKQL